MCSEVPGEGREQAAGQEAYLHAELTGAIIGAAFEVQRELGYGFLEKVCERALVEELSRRGIAAEAQVDIDVYYKGVLVGHYTADVLAERKVLVEMKTDKVYNPKLEAQLLHYLKATGLRVGLLLNFGEQKCHPRRLIR